MRHISTAWLAGLVVMVVMILGIQTAEATLLYGIDRDNLYIVDPTDGSVDTVPLQFSMPANNESEYYRTGLGLATSDGQTFYLTYGRTPNGIDPLDPDFVPDEATTLYPLRLVEFDITGQEISTTVLDVQDPNRTDSDGNIVDLDGLAFMGSELWGMDRMEKFLIRLIDLTTAPAFDWGTKYYVNPSAEAPISGGLAGSTNRLFATGPNIIGGSGTVDDPWIYDEFSYVYEFNPVSPGTLIQSVQLPSGIGAGRGATHDGTNLWISDADGNLIAFDMATGTTTSTLTITTPMQGLASFSPAVHPPGTAAFVDNGTSITANWTNNGNPTGTLYEVENTTTGETSDWQTDTFTWTFTGLDAATAYNFRVRAQSAGGDISEWTDLGTPDRTAPTVVISSPTTASTYATNLTPLAIAGTASDNVGVASITWVNVSPNDPDGIDDTGTATGTTDWNADVTLYEGDNVITVTATDTEGFTATATLTVTFTDDTAPIVTITSPTDLGTYATNTVLLEVRGTSSDDVGVANVTWENASTNGTETGTAITTNAWADWRTDDITLYEGLNTITITAVDTSAAGNTSTAVLEVTFTDNTAPVIAITDPTSDATYATNLTALTIGGTATDDVDVISVDWVSDQGSSGAATITNNNWSAASIPMVEGDNVITVTAADVAGNTSADTVTVTYTDMPTAPILFQPADGDSLDVLNPRIRAGAFNDPDGDTHAESEWHISLEGDDDFSDLVYQAIENVRLTSCQVPEGVLDPETTYIWRVRYIDNNGIASNWSETWSFITPADIDDSDGNGIPDDQEVQAGDDIDLDGDGTPDDDPADDMVTIKTVVDGMQVGLSLDESSNIANLISLRSIDPADITGTGLPSNYNMAFGLISFKVEVINSADPVTAVFYFNQPLADDFQWVKYDAINGVQDYTSETVISPDRRRIEITLIDGDTGDADNTVNNFVVDPSGPAVITTGGGGGSGRINFQGPGEGGRCFIATAAFGSSVEPHVMILRQFRDHFLMTSRFGQSLVEFYYTHSPKIADTIARHEILRTATRWSLLPLIGFSWLALHIGMVPALAMMAILMMAMVVTVHRKFKHNQLQKTR